MNFPEEHIQYLVDRLPEKLLQCIVSSETYEIFKQLRQDFVLTTVQFDQLTTIFNYLALGLLEYEYLPLEIQNTLTIDEYTAQKIANIIIDKIYRDIRIEVSKFKLKMSTNVGTFDENQPVSKAKSEEETNTLSRERLLKKIEIPQATTTSDDLGNLKSYRNYVSEDKTVDLDTLS